MTWALLLLGFTLGAAFANATRRRERLDISEAHVRAWRRERTKANPNLRVVK
jgi:hypothetical protein